MARCEICGYWVPDGDRWCYKCSAEALHRAQIEDGQDCFELEDEPSCPWCGVVLDDYRPELEDGASRGENRVTCPRCEKEIWLVVETVLQYSTYRTPPDGISTR